jgi:phage shock protein B
MFLIVILPIILAALGIAAFVLLIVMLFKLAGGSQAGRQLRAEESQLLQDIWKQLDRYEQRVTNLETILMSANPNYAPDADRERFESKESGLR